MYGMAEILRKIAKELYEQSLITESEYKAVLREIEKGEKR